MRVITDTVLEEYRKGRLDKVYVIFTHYVNAAVQEPVMIKLLPLSVENLKDAKVEYDYSGDILFDPSPEAVFERVVPQFIVATLFNAISQSSASEHAARMNAMQSATKNADEMLDRLRADYNARRQLAVTNELSETGSRHAGGGGKADIRSQGSGTVMNEISVGTVIRICGPVIDVRIENGVMLPIYALLECGDTGHHMEVAAQLGADTLRCIALEATDGLRCGTTVKGDGEGITIPVGDRACRTCHRCSRQTDRRAW